MRARVPQDDRRNHNACRKDPTAGRRAVPTRGAAASQTRASLRVPPVLRHERPFPGEATIAEASGLPVAEPAVHQSSSLLLSQLAPVFLEGQVLVSRERI